MKRIALAVGTLLGVVLATVGAAHPTVGAAAGTGTRAAAGTPSIHLVSQTLWVPATGKFSAVVRLADVPVGGRLQTNLHEAVRTRSAFDLTMAGHDLGNRLRSLPARSITRRTEKITVDFAVGQASATPGSTETVTLASPGVYPLDFAVTDRSGAIVASMVTYVVRLPEAAAGGTGGQVPLRVATELRLGADPTSTADGSLRVPTRATRAAGALTSGLADADTTVRSSLGFAISPALVDALANGRHQQTVKDLTTLSDGQPLQQLGWSRIDLARWLATPNLVDEAARLTDKGTKSLAAHLHRPTPAPADLGEWGTPVTDREVRWLADRSANAFLVPQDALSPLDSSRFPRALAGPFDLVAGNGRTVRAVQLDRELTRHFRAEDPVLGANQLLADLSVIALDLPAMTRGVVVASPVDWNPSKQFLETYVAGLGTAHPSGAAPLVAPTPLSDVVLDTPPIRAAGDQASTGDVLERHLKSGDDQQPLDELARQMTTTNGRVASLATMAPGGATRAVSRIAALNDQIDLAVSSGVGNDRRAAALAAVEQDVRGVSTSIELPTRQTITLTAHDASLPFTIRRPADGPTRVKIHIDARSRLGFPDGVSQLVRLDQPTTHFQIRVHSDSPGDAIVRVTVTSPDNQLISGTTEVVVRSTTASGVGLIISFGSLAFLFVWWGRDIVRVRRRRRERHVPPAELIDID